MTVGSPDQPWLEEHQGEGSVARPGWLLTADTAGGRKPGHCQILGHRCCSCRPLWRAQTVGFVAAFLLQELWTVLELQLLAIVWKTGMALKPEATTAVRNSSNFLKIKIRIFQFSFSFLIFCECLFLEELT